MTEHSTPPLPQVRTGQESTKLTRQEFDKRWREQFYHPVFESASEVVHQLGELAWQAYDEGTKSPRTRKAGAEFAYLDFKLPLEWLDARRQIRLAAERHADASGPSRILIVCGSPRTDETCPGEMSKTVRPVQTAMPRCHWPCSCYPNHATGQVHDWMHETYPRWVQAHGHHDRGPHALVSSAKRAEADDRPVGVRGRWQSRSQDDGRQVAREGRKRSSFAAGAIQNTSPDASGWKEKQ